MSWSQSLIRIATYEVETRQKQLAEIATRRADAETRLALLHAEGEAEAERARQDASAGWYHIGFMDGLRIRKTMVQAQIDALVQEEAGAREILSRAFEDQKKYEQIAESARVLELKQTAKRESADLDELGLRRAAR